MRLTAVVKATGGFSAMPRALRFLWQASPLYFCLTAIGTTMQGLTPAAIALIAKLIIDRLVDQSGMTRELWGLFLVEGFLAIFLGVTINMTALASSALREHVQKHLSLKVQAHAARLDLEFFERPAHYDEFAKAQREIAFRPFVIAIALFGIIANLATVTGFFAVVLAFQPVLAFALVLASLPVFIAGKDAGFVSFNTYDLMTPEGRRAAYIESLLTKDTFAKEVRLFNLVEPFFRQAEQYAKNILKARLKVERRRAINFSLSALLSVGVQYGALAFVLARAATGQVSIGDFVLLATALASVRMQLSEAFASSGELYENSLFFKDITSFLAHQPKICTPLSTISEPESNVKSLQIKNVTFTYPGAQKPVFSDLNVTFDADEVTAVVGVNGAGKTTLVKLLTRLYDPDSGKILYNGMDIKRFDPAIYRTNFGVIMQDFTRYQFSLKENVTIGVYYKDISEQRLEKSLHDADLLDLSASLREGIDTLLGRQFHVSGQDLSGGEWQRVALARALYRDAPVLILDEPTAALDAEAESRLFKKYREVTKGKLSIMISHRFNTVMMADRILVFDNGRVIEDGSHNELMQLGGRYASMFSKQAEAYLNDSKDRQRYVGTHV